MFKRSRLRLPYRIVNAGLAASLLFLAACSGENTDPDEKSNINNTPITTQENPREAVLQAVWATSPLDAAITSLAFVGGSEPILAATLSTGALQMFNLDGDRITAAVELGVKTIATGQAVILSDTPLTLFPGIGTDHSINLYAWAPALGDPAQLALLPDADAAGLCSGTPLDGASVMQLAYWTRSNPTELLHGHVQQSDSGELAWSVIDTRTSQNGPITACTAFAELEVATASTAINLAALNKFGQRFLIAQTESGELNTIDKAGKTRAVSVNSGITVSPPQNPTALAALSNVRYGNFPDGLIVLGGEVGGQNVITLIEPIGLFGPIR